MLRRFVIFHDKVVPCSECTFITTGCRGGQDIALLSRRLDVQPVLLTANVLTQYSNVQMKAVPWHSRQWCRFCNSRDVLGRGLFLFARKDDLGGSFLVAVSTWFGWLLQSFFFFFECQLPVSPKPRFVYKWWLYVEAFCLSSNQCLCSVFYSTHAHRHHRQALIKHCSTALYIAIWPGSFRCNPNWSLYISVRL